MLNSCSIDKICDDKNICKNNRDMLTNGRILELINNFPKIMGQTIEGSPYEVQLIDDTLYIFGSNTISGWLTNLDIRTVSYEGSIYHNQYLQVALNIIKWIENKNVKNIIGHSAGSAIAMIMVSLRPYQFCCMVTLCPIRPMDKITCKKIINLVQWISITGCDDPIRMFGSDFTFGIDGDHIDIDMRDIQKKNDKVKYYLFTNIAAPFLGYNIFDIATLHCLNSYCQMANMIENFKNVSIDDSPLHINMVKSDHKTFIYTVKTMSYIVRFINIMYNILTFRWS